MCVTTHGYLMSSTESDQTWFTLSCSGPVIRFIEEKRLISFEVLPLERRLTVHFIVVMEAFATSESSNIWSSKLFIIELKFGMAINWNSTWMKTSLSVMFVCVCLWEYGCNFLRPFVCSEGSRIHPYIFIVFPVVNSIFTCKEMITDNKVFLTQF